MRAQRWMWLFSFSMVVLTACSNASDKGGRSPVDPSGEAAPVLKWRETPELVESAPISLTSTDGAGLELVSLTARTVIEEPLALTELHLTFHNPENRVREGRFAITLPQEAAISRFAMRVGTAWQEGEVVERQRARVIYEDYLHRKQDPALLEQDAGNQFTARVFPIAPGEKKQLIVTYSEELAHSTEPYRLLLKGLPRLANLTVEVLVHQGEELSRLALTEKDHVPTADLAVSLSQSRDIALRSRNLVVARVAPRPKLAAEAIDGLTVLFDTSASRALSFEAQTERLGALLAALRTREGKDFPLQVIAFDQTSELIYEGPASAFSVRDKAKLLARDALGASNLGAVLATLATNHTPLPRMLIVSDGVITAGVENITSLREAVAKLSAHGVRRVDALLEGGIRDESTLRALTRAGLKQTGLVLDTHLSLDSLADKLCKATEERIDIRVPGASWVHPEVLEGVQQGDEFLVFAELDAQAPLRIELSGIGSVTPRARTIPGPLLERAVMRAKIAALEAKLRAARSGTSTAALTTEIVSLSTRHRVLSSQTALLVLESVQEYSRFGLNPKALANILQVGENGLEIIDRHRQHLAQDPLLRARDEAASDDVWGGRPRGEASNESAPAEPEAAREVIDREVAKGTAPPPGRTAAATTAPAATAPAKQAASAPSRVASASKADGASQARVRENAAAAAEGLLLGSLGSSSEGSLREVLADSESRAGSGSAGVSIATGGGSAAVAARRDAYVVARLHQASGLEREAAGSVIRSKLAASAKACYARASEKPDGTERLHLEFSVSATGAVRDVFISSGALLDRTARACVLSAAQRLMFPKPDNGNGSVEAGIEFSMRNVAMPVAGATPPRVQPAKVAPAPPPRPRLVDAYDSILLQTFETLARGDLEAARRDAEAAHLKAPGDVVALVALGEVLEAQKDFARAARVYGSLIDLFPSRTDLRRMAGARLERLPAEHGLALATDSYEKALAQRNDHPSGHRLLAYASLKQGHYQSAFNTIQHALQQGFQWDRFNGWRRILLEDLGLIGAAWYRAEPASGQAIQSLLQRAGATLDAQPSLRFVLNWETDANDVDFHIYDGRGGHASYMRPSLASGGALYADVINGYGPECFTIPGAKRAYPYVLQAHYYARGPMGYGMGKVQIIEHDGKGNLAFAEHPFTIMKDKAFVHLAEVQSRLAPTPASSALTLGTR